MSVLGRTVARRVLSILPALFSTVAAWGADGHTIVAHIAEALLPSDVKATMRADLGNVTLRDASTWCDLFDHSRAGSWSEPLHYINYPGHACDFIWDRDCAGDWCVAGALVNFSHQVFNPSLNSASRQMALEFLIHLMGDIHQPLHVSSGDDEGGNLIKLGGFRFSPKHGFWRNSTVALHAVWDSAIVDQDIWDIQFNSSTSTLSGGLEELAFKYKKWELLSEALQERLNTEWAISRDAWAGTIKGGAGNEARLRAGLTSIAGESAVLGCAYAYHSVNDREVVNGTVLDYDYYLRAKPIVEEQLAKAGVRLAQLLSDAFVQNHADAQRPESILV